MFHSNKRNATSAHRNNKKQSNLSLLLSTRTILLLTILILCLFSFYLSTKIPNPNPNQSSFPINDNQNININEVIDNPSINSALNEEIEANNVDDDVIIIHNNDKLKKAVEKSLTMYILRDGHDDRIEYLIGFRGERISDPMQYTKLSIRNNQKYDRDYKTSPIKISGWEPSPHECDALCVRCSHSCDVHGIRWSMENVEVGESDNFITGSTKLNSLVPVPYISYHDFGFMTAPKTISEKSPNGVGLAAAFISNCGFPKRNKMVADLQKYGVSVDSYGRCEHNKEEERSAGGRERTKIDLLSTHKFSLAFENSETDDYISEKYFGSLVSGSVPVYIGAPNIKFFAPDAGNKDAGGPSKPWKSKSIIYAGDFGFDAQKLANHLLYLDSNDTAYNEYVKWKYQGYSGDFKALIELTSTHTNCRQCILGSDWSRYKNGVTKYDDDIQIFDYSNGNDDDNKIFYVRQRGMYQFKLIKIESNTLKAFVKNVIQSIKPKEVDKFLNNEHPNYSRIGPALYAIYHVPSKHTIHSDVAIQHLPNYAELEVIFV